MSNDITELAKKFGSLGQFTQFLDEKINDGEQISKGKSPTDKSKEEKAAEQEAPAEGGEEMEPEAPVVDPVAAPGSQVAVGNKNTSKEINPEAKKLKVGKEKDKVDLKPRIEIEQ